MTKDTVDSLAALVGGQVHGDGQAPIIGVADLRMASPQHLGFIRDPEFLSLGQKSKAGALLVSEVMDLSATQIVVRNVGAAFARVALHFHPQPRAESHSIHPTAVVDPQAVLQEPVQVGPHAVLEAGVRVGPGTVIQAGVVVGKGCQIGADCVLYPRVVLYSRVRLGDRVILHAGCVLGADGFGYAPDGEAYVKVPQMGTVQLGDDVEVGANTTIDRGTLGATKVGEGSKLDNLVHLGHNCVLGKHNILAGFSALSGSTVIGDRVAMMGHTMSAGHVKVCDDARIGGNSVIYGDINEPGDYLGYPLQKKSRWGRTLKIMDSLVEMRQQLRRLQKAQDDKD